MMVATCDYSGHSLKHFSESRSLIFEDENILKKCPGVEVIVFNLLSKELREAFFALGDWSPQSSFVAEIGGSRGRLVSGKEITDTIETIILVGST